MRGQHRYRCLLGFDTTKISDLITGTNTICTAMGGNQAVYNAPSPALSVLTNLAQDLAAAQENVRARVVGAVAIRDEKRIVLVNALESERMYIQVLANASPQQAISIITGAGMKVANLPVHAKPLLDAVHGEQPGVVVLVANASILVENPNRRTCFNWQYTVDGGRIWVTAPTTPVASTTITGLPSLTLCGFRVSVTTKAGQTAWSQVVTLVVH
ncbi:MAG: hypothetical protein QM820_57195 [Minicystis sp.]